MLTGKLVLHDVQDAEALCARIIRQSGLDLSFHEEEDLLAYLVATAWELSERYEQGVIRKGFSLWATTTLKRRAVDWVRGYRGRTTWQFRDRTYERPRTELLSLNGELGESLSTITVDVEVSRSPDLMRALGKGSRRAAGADDGAGKKAARRAA